MSTQRFTQPCNVDGGRAIAAVATAIADLTRSRILWALLEGRAMPAGELAVTAGTSAQNASNHLSALLAEDLVIVHRQGRHRYYSLANALVAGAIESLLVIAKPATSTDAGRRPSHSHIEPWRYARSCYDHLAGRLAVELTKGLIERGVLLRGEGHFELGARGEAWLGELGIDPGTLRSQRRSFARECMDWTERRAHVGGAFGAALLSRMLELDWLRRTKVPRQIAVSMEGERRIRQIFGIDPTVLRVPPSG